MGASDVGDGQLLVFRGDGRRAYRVMKVLRPTEADWRSNYELNAKPRNAEILSALDHMSLSLWADAGAAVAISEQYGRRLGSFLAEVVLSPDFGIWFAETGPPGHLAVWGRREAFVESTTMVESF
jgi:hypothetical protein